MSTAPALRSLLRRILDGIDLTFCKMTRIQFDAPWRPDEVRRC